MLISLHSGLGQEAMRSPNHAQNVMAMVGRIFRVRFVLDHDSPHNVAQIHFTKGWTFSYQYDQNDMFRM